MGVQADALAAAGIQADSFLLLEVPDEMLIARVVGRRLDPETGDIYHLEYSPPPADIVDRQGRGGMLGVGCCVLILGVLTVACWVLDADDASHRVLSAGHLCLALERSTYLRTSVHFNFTSVKLR